MTVVAVAVAGAAGAVARYLIDAVASRLWSGLPAGTLLVNVAGSAAAGVLAGVAARHGVDEVARTVVGTGFLGAFTTFSTFAVDTVRLAEEDSPGAAAMNVATHVVSTVGVAAAGYLAAVSM